MSDERIDVTFGAKIRDLLTGLKEAEGATKESVEGMKASMEGLQAAAGQMMAPLLLVGAFLKGGELFGEAIEKTNELGEQLKVLSLKTGMAVDELSRLEYAAKMSDVSTESLAIGLQKLARNMDEAQKGSGPAAEAFERLGIRTTDASGHLRPMQDVLLAVADRFSRMENGAAKTALAMDLFGKSGAALVPLLNEGREGISRLQAEADRLGVTMTAEGVEAANAYDDAMKRFHATVEGVEHTMALALMPALTDAANAFTDGSHEGSAFKSVMELVAGAIRLVSGSVIETVGTLRALNTILSADLTKAGDFAAAWKKAGEQMAETGIAVRRAFGQPLVTDPQTPKVTPGAGGDGSGVPGASGMSKLERMQLEWLKIKEGQKDNFGDLSALELKFWQDRLGEVQAGSKEYLQIRTRIVALEQSAAKAGFDAELAQARAQEELDKDNLAQVVEDRKAELEIIRQHYGEMTKEVQEGIKHVNEAQHALQKESAKQWEEAFDAIPAAFSHATGQIGKEVFSLRDLFRSFFNDLLQMGIAAGAASLRHHVATELAKKNITLSSVAARVATETWAAVQSVALTAWSALKNIAAYAAEAAAATWAAISKVPYVGPFLAPAMAAGTLAGVLALGSHVASAAGGYDIPAGINPMTQLHANEMVLPAELANVVRGTAKGGGGGGAGTVVHIHAMDARSFHDFAQRNSDAFASSIATAVKGNHSGLNAALRGRG